MKPFRFFDHLKTEWNQSRYMYFILHLFWAVMEHDLVGFIKSIIVILTSVMPWNDERFLALKLRICNLCQRSLKNIIFFYLYLRLLLWVKKVLFSSIALPDRSDCFPFFHKAAQSLFLQFHFRFLQLSNFRSCYRRLLSNKSRTLNCLHIRLNNTTIFPLMV